MVLTNKTVLNKMQMSKVTNEVQKQSSVFRKTNGDVQL